MEIKNVRFNKNGDFNRADLYRLAHARIISVVMPDDPRHGPAKVVVEKLSVQAVSSPTTDFQPRPYTFHP